MLLKDIAGDHVVRIPIAGAMASASTDDEIVGAAVPFNATITAVYFTPAANVTANGTNYSALSVRNRGAAGSGSTLPASRSWAATNSAAFVREALTLSATASDLSVTAGDVLTAQRIHTASGVALPAGTVEVLLKAR